MSRAVRVLSSPTLRVALAVLVPSAIGISACRKAEPDEIVSVRPNTGGVFGGGSGGETPGDGSGGEGEGGQPAGSGGAATGGLPELDGSITETDSGPVEPPDCVVPEIPTGVPFSKEALLEQAADCAMGRYCLFSARAKALREVASSYAEGRTAAQRTALRNAWKEAMDSWQEVEQFRFGPAAGSSSKGGQNLRDLIYSYPATSRCKVDEQTLNRFYTSATFFGTQQQSLVAGRSLAALEYLSFYERPDNGCSSFSAVNAPTAWPSLSSEEIQLRRAAYAKVVAEDVARHAERLVEAWSKAGGDFRSTWTSAGPGNAVYPTQQDALNALNEALFYLEYDVKDLKLALPSGISPDCPGDTCPDSAEAPYAKVSTANLKQNVLGFRRLFQGCGENFQGVGFEDWLESPQVNRADLAGRIRTGLDAIDAELARLAQPIDVAVVADPAKIQALYAAVKSVTDPLKGEFVTVLNLELPGAVEGDND